MDNTIWTNTFPTGDYVTEMSNMRHTSEITCPECHAKTNLFKFKIHRDQENEITHWTYKHPCGALLTIFND